MLFDIFLYLCLIKYTSEMKQLLFVLILITTAFFTSCKKEQTANTTETIDTIPTLIMQIKKCSRLYTTEYHIHKIITHDDKISLKGTFFKKEYDIDLPLGKRKIAIPIDATIKAYIDFGDFSSENIEKTNGKINIILPDPKIAITSTTINHKDIKEYVALTRRNFSDEELSNYERQGRQAIVDDIPNMGLIDMARESAARTLIPMIRQMGYKESDITITFRKNFTREDFSSIIEKPSTKQ